jgi:hyperosmotically inducible periplasmic protein
MQRSLRSTLCGMALCGAFLVGGNLQAMQASQQSAPDNTSVNKRDRSGEEQTADQAKNNTSDRELMRHIRQDVVKDKSLSTYGHNVKIICDHGKVTLKGPVHSEEEKKAIVAHAEKYAGGGNVTDELTVKGEEK